MLRQTSTIASQFAYTWIIVIVGLLRQPVHLRCNPFLFINLGAVMLISPNTNFFVTAPIGY